MRANATRIIVGIAALVVGVMLARNPDHLASHGLVAEANAGPANYLDIAEITCKPFNLSDAGVGTLVNCGAGYFAVKAQNNTTTPVYFGGGSTFTPANVTKGQKHCSGCPDGASFTVDAYQRLARCMSGTADAGVAVQVICVR